MLIYLLYGTSGQRLDNRGITAIPSPFSTPGDILPCLLILCAANLRGTRDIHIRSHLDREKVRGYTLLCGGIAKW